MTPTLISFSKVGYKNSIGPKKKLIWKSTFKSLKLRKRDKPLKPSNTEGKN